MTIAVEKRSIAELIGLHDLYRAEANCQIVHDSFWPRGFVDAYAIEVRGRLAGYGAVANRYDKGKVIEFYVLPECRRHALPMFREFVAAAGATHMEAQTNIPLMLMLFMDCAANIKTEKVLFADGGATQLPAPPNIVFRRRGLDELAAFERPGGEAEGNWILERQGEIVATGGFLTHYNPPYADLFMEVAEPYRRGGLGGYLVQEIKRVCYASGKRPAARCNVTNLASRATLEKAGLLVCGHLLSGTL